MSTLRWALTALLLVSSLTGARAHHGSAEYDVAREVTVRGTVTAFRWINPHVRVVVRVTQPDGTAAEWDCEGPPLTWAVQQEWSESTLVRGETVTLVLYPPKTTAKGGLVKRIVRKSGTLEVSRPWIDQR